MIGRRKKRHLPLLAAALLALAVVGCGQDEETLIAQERADRILDLLDDAEQQFGGGECDELQETLENLDQQVTNINAEVEQEVRRTATEETDRLIELANQDCESVEEETTPEPTVTEETTPEPTVTEETETEETETEPTAPEDEEDGGDGGGPTAPPEDSSEGPGSGPPDEPPGQDNGSVTPPGGGPPEAEVPDDGAQADAPGGGA